MIYLVVDRFDFENFKDQCVFERCIARLPWMRSVIKFIAGFMLWVPKDPELAWNQVKRMEKEVKTEDDLIQHCQDVLVRDMP